MALREAIINAVCHRDYFDKRANVLIEVFSDRVVISNPGGLPSGLAPEEFGTKSVARNPLIASLLHRIDYIEKMGTGISRIHQTVAEHGGTELELHYNGFFTATFRAITSVTENESSKPTAATTPTPDKAHDEAHDKAHDEAHDLNETERKILAACKESPKSTPELLIILGYQSRTGNFKKAMARLCEQLNLLEPTLPDAVRSKNQRYRVTAKGHKQLNSERG